MDQIFYSPFSFVFLTIQKQSVDYTYYDAADYKSHLSPESFK